MVTKTYPQCRHCGRAFGPGDAWMRANYCRAIYVAEELERQPGRTTWEISQATGMPYAAVSKGLIKAREWSLVTIVETEQRDGGGVRYRYEVSDELPAIRGQWLNLGYL